MSASGVEEIRPEFPLLLAGDLFLLVFRIVSVDAERSLDVPMAETGGDGDRGNAVGDEIRRLRVAKGVGVESVLA
ncbi:MAG: hypothetical protein SOX39_13120 [Selenomonas sp.]|nr:hypothetical protein [Selenomonas sp.]MDY3298633.1 hypothetical protein [Selenomonas sp.]MDY4416193.1 hypothetical protein [Selenomonas sp.]